MATSPVSKIICGLRTLHLARADGIRQKHNPDTGFQICGSTFNKKSKKDNAARREVYTCVGEGGGIYVPQDVRSDSVCVTRRWFGGEGINQRKWEIEVRMEKGIEKWGKCGCSEKGKDPRVPKSLTKV